MAHRDEAARMQAAREAEERAPGIITLIFKGPVALLCTKMLANPYFFQSILLLIIKLGEKYSMEVVSKVNFSRRIEWRYFRNDPSGASHRKMVPKSGTSLQKWSQFVEISVSGPLLK